MKAPDKGFTVWFTGLPSSGKSTVAELLAKELKRRGHKVEILDGDVVRTNLSKGLGFSKEDRDINIRRIGFVCHLLSRNGVVAISAAISPYRNVRDENRKLIGDFVEVYVYCPLEECIKRDVKGLYKKALAGEIKEFTGISDPYEEPLNPEVVIETHKDQPQESVRKILVKLAEMGYISKDGLDESENAYTDEEEELIKQRLADLGYI
ncbi:MAG: adenylyl-sulfate kinase [bacterium]